MQKLEEYEERVDKKKENMTEAESKSLEFQIGK